MKIYINEWTITESGRGLMLLETKDTENIDPDVNSGFAFDFYSEYSKTHTINGVHVTDSNVHIYLTPKESIQ
jgi:hypothetical protein